MPFDRESFIKGYMTGLNLSRAPGGSGRRPRVPSGKYILTEESINIMTESKNRDDVSVYDSGVWYASNTTIVRYRFVTNYGRGKEISCKFIFASYSGRTPRMYYFATDPDMRAANIATYMDHDGGEYDMGLNGAYNIKTKYDKTLYIIDFPIANMRLPVDTIIARESSMFDITDLCWEIWYGPTDPLITEGG